MKLAKKRTVQKTAGIMKIHSYSTSPPHEKVKTRSSSNNSSSNSSISSRRVVVQKPNGVNNVAGGGRGGPPVSSSSSSARAGGGGGGAGGKKDAPVDRSPELDNKVNHRLAVESGKRTRASQQQQQQRGKPIEEKEKHEKVAAVVVRAKADSVVEEEQGEHEEEGEEFGESASKRRRRQQGKDTSVAAAAAAARGKEGPANKRGTFVVDAEEHEQEPDEPSLEFAERLAVEEEEEDNYNNEDDGTSSSTASAEEEIGEEMEQQQQQQQQQKGGPRPVTTSTRLTANSRGSSSGAGGRSVAATTVVMSEEEYDQRLMDGQVVVDDEETAMEYEAAMGGEELEDTDGALSGNRLFRKKVKRKLYSRGGGGGGGTGTTTTTTTTVGLGSAGSTITSSKANLQMLQEFPTLFIGLRRNRMFLVHSLAQSFDLKQRDIVLTLRKIKQNESSARLANFFGIGATEVDLLFHTSVPKIADCLRNFIVWPDDFTMKLNVPVSLRQHFNRIHLILNYLVLRVKQNAVQQLPPSEVATAYCPIDQCHKLKYLVASTLDGCVCFVSRAFGVQTDDEQLLHQSGFLTKFKTNTNLIAGQNFHNFEDRLANGHDHTNNNGGGGGGRGRQGAAAAADDDDSDLERVLGSCEDEDNFEDIVSEKISKSRTFKLKNYIENILENFQNHQMLSPHTCIDGRTFKLLDDIVVIVGALINLQKQEID